MTIPLFKVFMAPDVDQYVMPTLHSGYIGQGSKVEEFEAAFGELVGAPEPPLSMNSCTSALDLAFHLCGIGPGDEVITTPMTCSATNTGLVNRGARLIWADVDPVTGLIDPWDIGRKVEHHPNVKAVIGVDWAGRMADYTYIDACIEGAGKWDIPVIEDAAHALLAEETRRYSLHGGQGLPSWGGDYICWSFQAIKHLTTGDGGAVLCNGIAYDQMERARLLRWYGFDRRSKASFRCDQRLDETGYKYHMNDINASIGLANLPHARWVVEQHRANAAYYHENLKGLPGLTLPPPDPGSSWWLYSVLVPDRDGFIAALAEQGVEASPVHSRCDVHPAFARACANPNDPLPGVDHFAGHQVSIPVHWALTPEDRVRVCEAVEHALKVTA